MFSYVMGAGLTDLQLSAGRLDYWHVLLVLRATLAILAWGLLSLEHSPVHFITPPVQQR